MSVRTIRADELSALLDEIKEGDCVLLDVRERSEFESSHIPLAILMPVSELERRQEELDPEKKVVLYCRSGNRSKRAADLLASKGFKDINVLEGGITNWGRQQGPVERG